jgi:tetratricopeptide (TPR) repeat protein
VIDWCSSLRRTSVALVGVVLAAQMLIPAISSALVTRGDTLLYARDVRALEKYRTALFLDPANTDAADRYVFAAFLSRQRTQLVEAVDVARSVLARDPKDSALRMDRALCLQLLKRYAEARADFEVAGKQRADVQALALAAADARKTGDIAASYRLLLSAHRIDPSYKPVVVALARARI